MTAFKLPEAGRQHELFCLNFDDLDLMTQRQFEQMMSNKAVQFDDEDLTEYGSAQRVYKFDKGKQ